VHVCACARARICAVCMSHVTHMKEHTTHTNEMGKIEDKKYHNYDIASRHFDVEMYLIRCRDRVDSEKKGNPKSTRPAPARKRRQEKASSGTRGRTQNVIVKASESLGSSGNAPRLQSRQNQNKYE